jgi:hypothetical protein
MGPSILVMPAASSITLHKFKPTYQNRKENILYNFMHMLSNFVFTA